MRARADGQSVLSRADAGHRRSGMGLGAGIIGQAGPVACWAVQMALGWEGMRP